MRGSVYVCVCVRERERERESVCVCVCVLALLIVGVGVCFVVVVVAVVVVVVAFLLIRRPRRATAKCAGAQMTLRAQIHWCSTHCLFDERSKRRTWQSNL